MNTIWFRWHPEFTGSGQRAADKHFCVSKITGVRGKQAASDGTLPWFSLSPSPCAGRHGKKKKEKNWRETERGEGERSVKEERERDSTRWIMQSCQRRLLLEVLAVLKAASPDLHQLHLPLSTPNGWEPSDLCSGKWPTTRWGPGEVGRWARPLGDRWIVLEGHNGNDKYALYYRYLQRSPTGRSELTCTAAPMEI